MPSPTSEMSDLANTVNEKLDYKDSVVPPPTRHVSEFLFTGQTALTMEWEQSVAQAVFGKGAVQSRHSYETPEATLFDVF